VKNNYKFDENLAILDLDVTDANEAITVLGNLLLKNDCVTETFISAVIDREKEFPTGLQLKLYGAAIPHTFKEHVKQNSIAVGVLNKPVLFGNMGNINETILVKLIILMAIKDVDDQVDMLSRIVNLLKSEHNQEQLLLTKKPADIVLILNTDAEFAEEKQANNSD
jgi:PTS system galactitol-specific IIA component